MQLRVMHVVRPVEGGIREHVRQLAWGMPTGLVHSYIASPEPSSLFQQLPSWTTKCPVPITDQPHPVHDLQAARSLVKWADQYEIDILHVHGTKAAMIGWLAAKICQRPMRLIYTVHNFIEPNQWLIRGMFQAWERWIAGDIHTYVTVSNSLGNLIKNKIEVDAAKIRTVYNGVTSIRSQLSRSQIRQEWGMSSDQFTVGTIARLIPEKGVDLLLEALRVLITQGVNVHLIIIGDGPQRHALEQLAAGLPITWLGARPDASAWLRGLDLYVQPSRKEGFGMALVEAMMVKLPVIACATGGLLEIVCDGKNGLLIPPGNSLALIEAIKRCYEDRRLRERLGLQAQKSAMHRFTIDRMVKETWNIYQSCFQEGVYR